MKILTTIFLTILLINLLGCSNAKSIHKDTNKYGLTQEQYDFVKNETVPDGKLDFEKQFDANRLILIDNTAYNKKSAGLYTWALEMKQLGVQNVNEAIELYEELFGEDLRDSQKKAMKNAYSK